MFEAASHAHPHVAAAVVHHHAKPYISPASSMRKTAGHPGKKTASHAQASPPTGPAIHAAYSGPPPTANGDSYMVVHDHVLNVAASASWPTTPAAP